MRAVFQSPVQNMAEAVHLERSLRDSHSGIVILRRLSCPQGALTNATALSIVVRDDKNAQGIKLQCAGPSVRYSACRDKGSDAAFSATNHDSVELLAIDVLHSMLCCRIQTQDH
jgi:hypothetical protein